MGAHPPSGRASLRAGLCVPGSLRLHRTAADLPAEHLWAGIALTQSAVVLGCDTDDDPGVLPLCLSPGPRRFPWPGRRNARDCTQPRALLAARLCRGDVAHRTPGARGWRGAGDDGSPGRFWYGGNVWLPDAHGSHLPRMVWHVRPSCRHPTRQWAAVLCPGLVVRGAHLTRASAFHGDVSPWRRRHPESPTGLASRPGHGGLPRSAWAWLPLARWTIGTVDAGDPADWATGASFRPLAAAYALPGWTGDRPGLSHGCGPGLCQPAPPFTRCPLVCPMLRAGLRSPRLRDRRRRAVTPRVAGSYCGPAPRPSAG